MHDSEEDDVGRHKPAAPSLKDDKGKKRKEREGAGGKGRGEGREEREGEIIRKKDWLNDCCTHLISPLVHHAADQ